jgi:hypothetical protein
LGARLADPRDEHLLPFTAYREQNVMTDIRRTILWVVFTMSLVLLWDGWNLSLIHI